jgi:hypothetical protein
MRKEFVWSTLKRATKKFPELRKNNAIIHSDRGGQYKSKIYRKLLENYGIRQSLNSGAGRCYDNAKCESQFGRFKTELIYNRYDTKEMLMTEVKDRIQQYFLDYWNRRRICMVNDGLPPFEKRKNYYLSHGIPVNDEGIIKNTLAVMNPELAKEWDYEANEGLTPNDVSPNSDKKVGWIGKCGHKWITSPSSRSRGCGCPICNCGRVLEGFNDLPTVNPKLAQEWHPTWNGKLTPQMFSATTALKVYWLCPKCNHEWPANISSRNKGLSCPNCYSLKLHEQLSKAKLCYYAPNP